MVSFKTKMVFLGAALFFVGASQIDTDSRLSALAAEGVSTTAMVTRLTHDPSWWSRSRRRGFRIAYVSFRTATGQPVHTTVHIGAGDYRNLRVGSPTTITYLPSAPEVGAVGRILKSDPGADGRLVIILGLFLGGAAAWFAAWNAHTRERPAAGTE